MPLIISPIFLTLEILNAKILTSLNKARIKFCAIVGSIVTPIVMVIIFFGIVTPNGLLLIFISKDVFNCFMGNELNTLVIGNCFLKKNEQDPKLKKDYKD